MLYLYRFEVLDDPNMGDLTAYNGAVGTPIGAATPLAFFTNYERPVSATLEATQPPLAPYQYAGNPIPQEFTPALISHEGLRLDGEKGEGQMAITVAKDNAIAALFALDYPRERVMVSVLEVASPGATPLFVFVGFVGSCDFAEQTATLNCYPLGELLESSALTGKYSRTCGFQVYDAATCGKNPNQANAALNYWAFREDGIATAYDGATLTLTVPAAANQADGWWTEGFVLIEPNYIAGHRPRGFWLDPNVLTSVITSRLTMPKGGVKRKIIAHTGTQLVLATPLTSALPDNAKVSLFAGCDKLKTTCETKFANDIRYGGYPYIPIKNVFESGLIDLEYAARNN